VEVKMKQKITYIQEDEIDELAYQLDPREMYILGFLKGSNRQDMKKMSEEGLFNIDYY
jgi:hypothetical protein